MKWKRIVTSRKLVVIWHGTKYYSIGPEECKSESFGRAGNDQTGRRLVHLFSMGYRPDGGEQTPETELARHFGASRDKARDGSL